MGIEKYKIASISGKNILLEFPNEPYFTSDFYDLLGKKIPELIPIAQEANGSYFAYWKGNDFSAYPIVYISSEWMPFQIAAIHETQFLALLHYGLGPMYQYVTIWENNYLNPTALEQQLLRLDAAYFDIELSNTNNRFVDQELVMEEILSIKFPANQMLTQLRLADEMRIEFANWKIEHV